MDLNTNMMVVMDMIAMQNMMAQQQRDMFYAQQSKKTSQLYNGQENGQEKYCENNQSLKQKHDENKDYRWNNTATDYIPPSRDISPIQLLKYTDLSYIDSKGVETAFCKCYEEDNTLIIEASVPEDTLTKEEVQTWLFDTVKKAKDRYVSKIKFRIGAEDIIMKQFVKI